MPKITNIYAREVIDSRGNPTVEVEVTSQSGAFGRAIVPSGASTGDKEALELRDNDATRFHRKGVLKAVENVNTTIKEALLTKDVTNQNGIDAIMIELDGTEDKSNLGANAILGVSIACAHAASDFYGIPLFQYLGGCNAKTLPVPMMNVINGGSHADSTVDFQEYMIVPVGASSLRQAVQMGSEVFHCLKTVLQDKGYNTSVGDEGGFAPNCRKGNEEPLELIIEAIIKAGYKPKKDICIALDIAASEFYNVEKQSYEFYKSKEISKNSDQMIELYCTLCEKYPIISIEDGLDQNDWDGWKKLTDRLQDKIQLVGDDLFVTNPTILQNGIKQKIANSILIKVNQIGTLSQALDAIELAKKSGYTCVVSHRSGESEDTTIADIAVGLNAGQIKTGSMSRSERICKYNQLLRIEDILGNNAVYPGMNSFNKLQKN